MSPVFGVTPAASSARQATSWTWTLLGSLAGGSDVSWRLAANATVALAPRRYSLVRDRYVDPSRCERSDSIAGCVSAGNSAAAPHHRAKTRVEGFTGAPPSIRSSYLTVTAARAVFEESATLVATTWNTPTALEGAM